MIVKRVWDVSGKDADVTDADLWLQRLHPDPDVAVPAPASRPVTVADAVERLGKGPVEWACQVGYAMTERIIAEIPDFGGGPEQFESLRMGPESSVIRSLIWISSKGRACRPSPRKRCAVTLILFGAGSPWIRSCGVSVWVMPR